MYQQEITRTAVVQKEEQTFQDSIYLSCCKKERNRNEVFTTIQEELYALLDQNYGLEEVGRLLCPFCQQTLKIENEVHFNRVVEAEKVSLNETLKQKL